MTYAGEVLQHAIRTYLNQTRHSPRPSATPHFSTLVWAQAVELAKHHHLEPILQRIADNAPPVIQKELLTATRQRRIRNVVMGEAFATIQQKFECAGIMLLPLKGIVFAHTLYKRPADRYFDDLDLLIDARHSAESTHILKQLGYQPHPRARQGDWHHLPPLVHSKHGTTVELHTDLSRRISQAKLPLSEVWNRAQPVTIAGVQTHTLHPLDALIFSALHARHHLFSKANFLLDGLLLTMQNTCPLAIVRHAQQNGAAVPLGHLYEVAHRWGLGSDLPKLYLSNYNLLVLKQLGFSAEFTPRPNELLAGPLPHMLELLLMDNSAEALALAYALLFNPNRNFVATHYKSRMQRLTLKTKMAAQQVAAILKKTKV